LIQLFVRVIAGNGEPERSLDRTRIVQQRRINPGIEELAPQSIGGLAGGLNHRNGSRMIWHLESHTT